MNSAQTLIASDTLRCEWATAPYYLFSDNVFSPLIYYSHLFPTIAGLLLAFIVWRQGQKLLVNRLFIFLSLTFAVWCLLDLVLWAEEDPDIIMFIWSALIYINPMLYLASAYLLYVFATNRDFPFYAKMGAFLIMVPVLVLAPTSLNLVAFDYTNCDREAIEGPLWTYNYLLEILVVLWMSIFTLRAALIERLWSRRVQVGMLGIGLIAFLAAFSWGNIVGSISEDWALAQYGLFGMPILLAVVIYLIVRFQTFRIQVIGTSALVTALWLLLFSILFLQTLESARPIIIATLVLFALIGIFLVRSVRREIESRRRVEQLATDLEKANDRLKELDQMKSEFLSVATHQLRAPLTAMRGYASLIAEGSYGPVTEGEKEPLFRIMESGRNMANSIEDYLNVSRIEQGRMKFESAQFDLTQLADTVVKELTSVAERRNLKLTLAASEPVTVKGDIGKIKQVMTNYIDNAIKYTPQGFITVRVWKEGTAARFAVEDTGTGIAAEELPKLFSKFTRARDANKVNTTGTGLGLYVAKILIEGHKGKTWAESEGIGKGSRFIFEIPV